MKQKWILRICLPVWILGTVLWACYINVYAHTPDEPGKAPLKWPVNAVLSIPSERPMLVMFLHPGCPCSRASLWELEEMQAKYAGKIGVTLVMVSDESHAGEWANSLLQRQARELQNVTIVQDVGGALATRFCAEISGETYLYDDQGNLRFHGGITAARGHMGPAPGQDAIAAVLTNPDRASVHCNVFGCQLSIETLIPDPAP